MTDNTIRDQFTETEENPGLAKPQFYIDTGGLNIGYGFNLSLNLTTAEATLKIAGFGNNLTDAQWSNILSVAANPTSAGVVSLNSSLGSGASISQTAAQQLLDNYYTTSVDNVLPGQLEKYAGLTAPQVSIVQANPYAWAALQDILYTAPSAFSGNKIPNLNADLSTAINTGNWGNVAYDIGFNPATEVFNRREDESLLVLGFNSAGFAENSSTTLTPISSTSVNNQSVITYEQLVATGDQEPFSETQTAILNYLITQGYYVPQSNDGTSANAIAASVSSQLVNNGISVTSESLKAINQVFPDSSLAVGGLMYVPAAALTVGPSPVTLPALSGNFVYVFDPSSDSVYAVGADLKTGNAGQFIIDTNGLSIPASLITSIYAGASTLTLTLADGTGATTDLTLPTSSSTDLFASGIDYQSILSLNPEFGSLNAVSYIVGSGLKFNLSQSLNGLPLSVLSTANGGYSLGIDPPDSFTALANFAPDGLNGDTVSVLNSGSGEEFQVAIGAGATAELVSDSAEASLLDDYLFTTKSGVLKLDSPGAFSGTISNFQAGDTIDLAGITATSATLGPDNVLTVFNGSDVVSTLSLDPSQTFSNDIFVTNADSNGGTNLTVEQPLIGISYNASIPMNYLESINPATGQVSVLNSFTFDTGYWYAPSLVDTGADVYAVSSSGLLYDFSAVTGALKSTMSVGDMQGLAPSGNSLLGLGINAATDQDYLESINPMTGAIATLNSFPAIFFDVTYDPFFADSTDAVVVSAYGILYDYDATTGALKTTFSVGGGLEAFAGSGNTLLGINFNSTTAENSLETINLTTGQITTLNTFKFDTGNWTPLTFTDNGTDAYAVSSDGLMYEFNATTGALVSTVSISAGNLEVLRASGNTSTPSTIPSSEVFAPVSGQTEDMATELITLSLTSQGAVQNVTIEGPGTVALTAETASVPNIEVANGGMLALQNGTLQTDPITIDAGGIISGSGTITGNITDNGMIAANGGLLDLTDSITGMGVLDIDTGSTLELDGTVANNITFTGSDAALLFGTAASDFGAINGLTLGDTLGIADDQVTLAVFDSAANELLLSGADGETITTTLSGDFTQNNFTIDANGNIEILCFAKGTRIRTPKGEVAVNKLAIGDLVSTLGGCQDRIKFIGKRSYGAPFITNKLDALPIRIKANAIADGVPACDLRVSPGHALFIDGVLVPASRLINGKTITQDINIKRVDYFHIELENGHNILIAENCAAESFRNEAGFRNQFQNAAEFYARYPGECDSHQASCAPRTESGFRLYAIQQHLAARAGIAQPAVTDTTLRGYVDIAGTDGKVSGWAQFESAHEVPVPLDIWIGGTLAARVLANAYRGDLRNAGLGSGGHGFEATIPAGLTGNIEVRRSGSGDPALPLSEVAARKRIEADNVTFFRSVKPMSEVAREDAAVRGRLNRGQSFGLRAG